MPTRSGCWPNTTPEAGAGRRRGSSTFASSPPPDACSTTRSAMTVNADDRGADAAEVGAHAPLRREEHPHAAPGLSGRQHRPARGLRSRAARVGTRRRSCASAAPSRARPPWRSTTPACSARSAVAEAQMDLLRDRLQTAHHAAGRTGRPDHGLAEHPAGPLRGGARRLRGALLHDRPRRQGRWEPPSHPPQGSRRSDRAAACVVGDGHAGLEVTLLGGERLAPGQPSSSGWWRRSPPGSPRADGPVRSTGPPTRRPPTRRALRLADPGRLPAQGVGDDVGCDVDRHRRHGAARPAGARRRPVDDANDAPVLIDEGGARSRRCPGTPRPVRPPAWSSRRSPARSRLVADNVAVAYDVEKDRGSPRAIDLSAPAAVRSNLPSAARRGRRPEPGRL